MTRAAGPFVFVLLGAQACATAAIPTGQQSTSPLGPASGARKPVPESLKQLVTSVEALGAGADDFQHHLTTRALRDLANAVESLSSDAAAKIRDVSQRVESSAPTSLPDAETVKEGLARALQGLVTSTAPSGRQQEFQRAIVASGRAVDALTKDSPLLEQRSTAAAAFRAVADVVFIARGGEAPFGEANVGGRESAPSATVSLEAALKQARADVLKLGQTKWMSAPLASSHALSSLADVIVAADRSHSGTNLDTQISSVRFQAERLRRSAGFGQGEWVKTGLVDALDALDAIQLGCESPVSPWNRSARRAVAGIEERDSLTFQRAAVQDAFRATVGAFVAASTQACP